MARAGARIASPHGATLRFCVVWQTRFNASAPKPYSALNFSGGEPDMSTATKSKPQKKSTSSIKLQPLGDRVVVEREESEGRTAGGIVLPDAAKDKPARGTVISVGNGRLLEDGTRHKVQVKPGDRVVFSSYAGEQFKVGDSELLLMREDDILAVIEE
jgi:chaperonin GroES